MGWQCCQAKTCGPDRPTDRNLSVCDSLHDTSHRQRLLHTQVRRLIRWPHIQHCHSWHPLSRSWRLDPESGSYLLVSTSVSHASAELQAGIRATDLASHYLIEPREGENSRLTLICRVDTRYGGRRGWGEGGREQACQVESPRSR